ncbi:MAG: DNA replication/repair protein RecF [Rhodospirillaceae bacterium]|nr:DNA replication/repair protein RecF [Rhodospirillaceae bacterium]
MRRLDLANFRAYVDAHLDLDPRPVVLTGPNGAGKTNLLEAISFLAPGRGLRRASLAEAARHGAGPLWAVAARLDTPGGPVALGTGPDPDAPQGSRRAVRINGAAAASQTALAEFLTVSWLTPQMDRLFLGPAGDRRRFLDRIVYGFDPAHAGRVSAYEQAMRERNRLLKQGMLDDAWLSGLEQVMAETGVAVAAARGDVVARLRAAIAQAGEGAFPKPDLALAGATEGALAARRPALEVEDALKEDLARRRRIDAAAGVTTDGPHRTDLHVSHAAKGVAADQCSTGEQKALLIGLVLANARLLAADRGVPPLLLLDEVAAHLDAARRAALFDAVLALGSQVWMTGTDALLFEALGERAQWIAVHQSTLSPGPTASPPLA